MTMKKMTRQEVLAQHDCSHHDLSELSLGNCDLAGKDFRGADLSGVHLGRANLCGADLRGANLSGANLGAADLSGANLRDCDLRDAHLHGAVLLGADTRGCLGMNQPFVLNTQELFKPLHFEESESCKLARAEGFLPINEWAKVYRHREDGVTLFAHKSTWQRFRDSFGEMMFGDKTIFEQVRLVQQYVNYGRWTYLITRDGFERLLASLGVKNQFEAV